MRTEQGNYICGIVVTRKERELSVSVLNLRNSEVIFFYYIANRNLQQIRVTNVILAHVTHI